MTYEKTSSDIIYPKRCCLYQNKPDLNIPTELRIDGVQGAINKLLEAATRVQPVFIGKPNAIIMNKALDVLGVKREEAIIVGIKQLI